jgi:hypothetical protein
MTWADEIIEAIIAERWTGARHEPGTWQHADLRALVRATLEAAMEACREMGMEGDADRLGGHVLGTIEALLDE